MKFSNNKCRQYEVRLFGTMKQNTADAGDGLFGAGKRSRNSQIKIYLNALQYEVIFSAATDAFGGFGD